MKIILGGAIVASLLWTPAGSAAAGDAGNRNVRCLMLSNLYVRSAKDDRGRQAASATRLFYLGRIDDRMTDTQLEAAMLAAGKTITPATAGSEMNKCAQTLEQRTKAMTAIGDRLRSKLEK